MRIFNILKGIRGSVTMYNRSVRFASMYNEAEVTRRTKILTFYDTHGLSPTKDAFGVSRATIFRWKKALSTSRGKLNGLDPHSTRPHRTRTRFVDRWVEEFIIDQRKHVALGKEKLHVLLQKQGYEGSVNTVGRILTDLKRRGQVKDPIKYSLYARTGKLHVKKRTKAKKLRKPKEVPCVQIDTVVRHVDGIKSYTITAIDTVSRFSYAHTFLSHGSQAATIFLKECIASFPVPITSIQTDNGSEFAGYFSTAMVSLGLTHFHTYPRCPDQNAYIERMNRTLSEEFLRTHRSLLRDNIPLLNKKMEEYLLWYNTTRPHHGLGLRSPLEYISDISKESHM